MLWNSFYCVADELIAREYAQLRCAGRFGLPRAYHVAHFSEFLGSVYVRATWTTFVGVSTCAPRGPHLLECLRAHHVDHICCADGLISVVVIAIRLRVMTQIIFGAAGVARAIFLLSRACPHIWFHMCIRVCYVARVMYWGKDFWGTLVCVSSCVPHFLRCKIRLYWNFSLIGWRLIVILGVENWRLKIILPRPRI